jgi:hypothetical protein
MLEQAVTYIATYCKLLHANSEKLITRVGSHRLRKNDAEQVSSAEALEPDVFAFVKELP